ncbi:hypothetical protein [Fluviispira sanaruensis]|uniref:Uncharacterized protein n=1 Tax=Fluviispira sanaruensis TaxID=2493639 RepID=A0A4P2VVC7_FLUSA|nr:hypothetical protein [Fluviispira sanaruensis]BBH53485.1 hypothetical protein JCM31447_19290 [Fluviispira sanaruensis]
MDKVSKKIDWTSSAGQVLVESLITQVILAISAFALIEIVRLLAFKAVFKAAVSDIALQISHSELALKRNGSIPQKHSLSSFKSIVYDDKIKKQLQHTLKLFPTSFISFEKELNAENKWIYSIPHHNYTISLQFVFSNLSHPEGVYLKVTTCLPVLFSSFFNPSMQVGRRSQAKRNCLGHFAGAKTYNPIYWYRVRVSTYVPWPASTQIFEKGLAMPVSIYGLEENITQETMEFIREVDLSQYIFKEKKEN